MHEGRKVKVRLGTTSCIKQLEQPYASSGNCPTNYHDCASVSLKSWPLLFRGSIARQLLGILVWFCLDQDHDLNTYGDILITFAHKIQHSKSKLIQQHIQYLKLTNQHDEVPIDISCHHHECALFCCQR